VRIGPIRAGGGSLWIGAAYAALAIVVLLDYVCGGIHLGVLAIIPLMLIGFFCGRLIAIATAFPAAIVLALLDHDVLAPLVYPRLPVAIDAVFLAAAFLAILFTADRLRFSEFAASQDVLTSLPNRRSALSALDAALERSRKKNTSLALLFIDLDNFKTVNDRHGHAVGDRILKHAAERLARGIRKMDTIGRIGGDEFVVLLEDMGVDARMYAERVAESLKAALSIPFHEGAVVESIGATIGVAIYPSDARDITALLECADRRMYERKPARSDGRSPA
jgi:diguanylate cyclase (GGDEF)-like protein